MGGIRFDSSGKKCSNGLSDRASEFSSTKKHTETPMLAAEMISNLERLSPAELRDLAARATFLASTGGSSTADEALPLVFSQVQQILKDAGVETPPLKVVKAQGYYKALLEGSDTLIQYINANLHPESRGEKIKGVQVLLRMLVRWLENCGIPVSVGTVARNLSKVPSLVEKEFPGYRESGLLPIILKRYRIS